MRAPAWLILVAFTLGTLAVGLASGLTAAQTTDQYRDLDQPSWAPPPWLFGPVWTVLYLMVGLAGYLIWAAAGWSRPLGHWAVQLGLNLAWTPLFFGLGLRGLALVDIAALLLALVATAVSVWPVSRPAAWLLLPYGLWVCFATALNASIWILSTGDPMPMRDASTIEFGKVYPLYVQKVERKGRSKAELDQVIRWLTGYDAAGLRKQVASSNDFRAFFAQAPALNPARALVTGMICGVRIEDLDDPAVQAVRQLDKLVDELAKGRPMQKVLRS